MSQTMTITKIYKKKGNTMSKIGNVNLMITEIAEDLGIENDPANFTDSEKAAVKVYRALEKATIWADERLATEIERQALASIRESL
jgi:ABC-type Zn uptake system ZnuABC Zn-binding protein ZnuA